MKTRWIIYDVNNSLYWSDKGWVVDREKATSFAYEMLAHEAAKGLNNGIGMRVERA